MQHTPALSSPAHGRPGFVGFTVPRDAFNVASPEALQVDAQGRFDRSAGAFTRGWQKAYSRFKKALASPQIKGAVLLVGLPGSGKSTWLEKNYDSAIAYFDAVLATPGARAPLIRMAQAAGKPITIVHLDTPVAVAKQRNSKRPPERRVPDASIEKSVLALATCAPSTSEGAARVIRVR